MATLNWHALSAVPSFLVECDAIEASLIVEAVQSHARELNRKRELHEASKASGAVHFLAILAADEKTLAAFVARVQKQLAQAVAASESEKEKRELFAEVGR